MAFHVRNLFTRKNKPTLKRNNRGSRNLLASATRNKNMKNRRVRNFVNMRILNDLEGYEILYQAPANIKNDVRKYLNSMGMLNDMNNYLSR